MEQLKVVGKYIKEKLPNLNKISDNLYSFLEGDVEKKVCIVQEKVDGDRDLLFSKDFKLILSKEEKETKADMYAFCFGDLYYYVKQEDLEDTKLNILRYLGHYSVSNKSFCHLGVHSTYTLLDGCQKLESYVEKAKFLGAKSLGICEKQTLSSCFKFQKACQKGGIKPIIGEELKVRIGKEDYWYKLYIKTDRGYTNLVKLSNIANTKNKENFVFERELLENSEDLVCVLPNDFPFSSTNVRKYKNVDIYYQLDTIEYLDHNYYKQKLDNVKNYLTYWHKEIPIVLITDSYYLDKEDKILREYLHKIGRYSEFVFASKSLHYKSIEEHLSIFYQFWKGKAKEFDKIMKEAISNTTKIADSCQYNLTFQDLHIPTAIIDGVQSRYNLDFLEKVCRDRMDELGFTGIAKYEDRLKEEYDLIVGAGLENYFLIIWDILNWCKQNNLLVGLARGSAAGSFLMFLMDIVKVNPFDYHLLFSRFLNAGRVAQVYLDFIFDDEELSKKYSHIHRLNKIGDRIAAKYFKGDLIEGQPIKDIKINYKGRISLPDVDMDVSDREKIKKFIVRKYGLEQFAILGSYNNFLIKSGIKDLGKYAGANMSYSELNYMTNNMFFKEGKDAHFEELFKTAMSNKTLYTFIQENPNIVNSLYWLLDTPKSNSAHPCGVLSIPATESIFSSFPLVLQGDEYMCEWTGPELDELGFVKNDLLGLNQLNFFENTINLIKKHKGVDVDIYNLPLDDEEVFKKFQQGFNSEIFQFNSYLLVNYCKLLKPTCVQDLAAAVSAVRPGPLNNGLHIKYARRKHGEEEAEYKFGYEKYTKETYGIILYQEQVIQIASELGDLTLEDGDSLRRIIGKKYMDEMLEFYNKIKPKAISKGCSEDEFKEIWEEWVEFAKYAFNKSHAVAYSLIGYISQWLKVHYPLEFWTAALEKSNGISKKKEKFNQYFQELKDSNSPIKVVGAEINKSSNKTEFEGNEIYMPLNNIKYLGVDGVEQIIKIRNEFGDFYSLEEFLVRLGTEKLLNKREFENLILSGAFDKVENIKQPKDRERLIRELYKYLLKDYEREFIKEVFQRDNPIWWELKQLELTGLNNINFNSLCQKYFGNYRFFTTFPKYIDKQKVSCAGIISSFVEKKTKRGEEFGIIELECDNIPYSVIAWPDVWEKVSEEVQTYENQIILFEGEFSENPKMNSFQIVITADPLFIGSDGTKIKKPKALSFRKGDIIETTKQIQGKVVRNASNLDIEILTANGETLKITKWDIQKIVELK